MDSRIFLFRNCFTGAVAGGDVHSSDVFRWIKKNLLTEQDELFLVRPKDDQQEDYYSDVPLIKNLQFPSPNTKRYSILYVVRTLCALIFLRLSLASGKNYFVASSHFWPDVIPVALKGFFKRNVIRTVYIHHIIRDMDRPSSLLTRLAGFQERVSFCFIRKFFDRVIVVNSETRQRLGHYGIKNASVLLSSNPVTFPAISVHPFEDRKLTCVFCGRFVPQKGVWAFLEICEQLSHEMKNFSAAMVGTGPLLPEVKAAVKQRKLPIHIPGYVGDLEKYQYLTDAKIFLFPSVEEGWGMAVAEALRAGSLVAAYDLPAYREVFSDFVNVVPVGDGESLKALVTKLINQELSLAQDAQERQMVYATRFDVGSIARKEFSFITA